MVNVASALTGTVVALIDDAVPDDRVAVNRPIPNAAATQPIAPRAIGHRRMMRFGTGAAVTSSGALKRSRGVMTDVDGGPGRGRGGGATLIGGGGIARPSRIDGGSQDIRSRSPSFGDTSGPLPPESSSRFARTRGKRSGEVARFHDDASIVRASTRTRLRPYVPWLSGALKWRRAAGSGISVTSLLAGCVARELYFVSLPLIVFMSNVSEPSTTVKPAARVQSSSAAFSAADTVGGKVQRSRGRWCSRAHATVTASLPADDNMVAPISS
jgi:hypothetical protein